VLSGGTWDAGQLYGSGHPISVTGGIWSGAWTFGLGAIGGTYNDAQASLTFSGSGLAYVVAAATAAAASGAVTGITVSDGASGYGTAPAVSIVGGGGSGATATAAVASGVVTGITVTNAGSGYTSAPSVVMAYSLTGTLTGGGSLAIVTTLDTTNGLNTQCVQVTSTSVTFSG
jgi:hypothetical protein